MRRRRQSCASSAEHRNVRLLREADREAKSPRMRRGHDELAHLQVEITFRDGANLSTCFRIAFMPIGVLVEIS